VWILTLVLVVWRPFLCMEVWKPIKPKLWVNISKFWLFAFKMSASTQVESSFTCNFIFRCRYLEVTSWFFCYWEKKLDFSLFFPCYHEKTSFEKSLIHRVNFSSKLFVLTGNKRHQTEVPTCCKWVRTEQSRRT